MKGVFSNWGAGRIIRLLAGIGFGIYAIVSKNYPLLMIAGLFAFQAILNASCCCGTDCTASDNTERKPLYTDEIETYNPEKYRQK